MGGYSDVVLDSAGSGMQWGCGAAIGREERRCGMMWSGWPHGGIMVLRGRRPSTRGQHRGLARAWCTKGGSRAPTCWHGRSSAAVSEQGGVTRAMHAATMAEASREIAERK